MSLAVPRPRPLRHGGLIEIVSPASPVAREKLDDAIYLLENQGYRVRLAKHALSSFGGFLAGPDEERASDLDAAFTDPEVAAVLCARGGYGCGRLMQMLDFDKMAASGKLFVGFSDVTVLHLALNRRGLPTVYAPMALTFSVPREPWVVDSFLSALRGEVSIPANAPRGEIVVPGIAEGVVTGGCLCLLCDSIGTNEPLDTTDRILLIEDVDEPPHRLDAMLTHLLNTGLAQKAAGFVIGEMTGTEEKIDLKIGSLGWRDIFIERLGRLGKPMILNFPFGHMKTMLSLPLGIKAKLDAEQGTLSYTEPLCV